MPPKEIFTAKITDRFLLNKPGSSKETWHITLSAEGRTPSFQVGDSIAIYPKNDPEEVSAVLKQLGVSESLLVKDSRVSPALPSKEMPILELLSSHYNIQAVPSRVIDFLQGYKKCALKEHLFPHTLSEWLMALGISNEDLPLEELVSKLQPLVPRFYSIASTPLQVDGGIDLMVAKAWYDFAGQKRLGVCSNYLISHAQEGISAYIQPTRHFLFPSDPHIPLLLIGPGTGLAPFRAYLQDRLLKQQLSGKVWLFFGERQKEYDYFYDEFWEQLQKEPFFRMSLAFSRDTPQKIYVQHRLWEARDRVWDWLQQGGQIYVCGDAKNMARDVETTLLEIFKTMLGSEDKAREYLKELRSTGRYLRDIY